MSGIQVPTGSGAGGAGGAGGSVPLPKYTVAGAGSPAGVAAAADGTDLATALAQAGAKEIHVWGSHTLSAVVTVSGVDDVQIIGHNGATIYTPDSSSPGVYITGSRTDVTPTISGTTLAQGTYVITYTGTDPALAAGDYVGLTTTVAFGGAIAERPGENFTGEMMRVFAVDTTAKTITMDGSFRDTYTISGLKLYRYNFVRRTRVSGISFVAPGGAGHSLSTATNRCRPMVIEKALMPLVTDCTVSGTYAKEGLSLYECWHPITQRCHSDAVNDAAGVSGTYEAYGFRAMGCEHPVYDLCTSHESRHGFEVNGGQSGYGYGTGVTRPITYSAAFRDCTATQAWSAGGGDHPGAADTVYENFVALHCSGGIFSRGRRTRIVGKFTCIGSHHLTGPYSANQGNDHAITIGEQLRDAASANRVDTHDGWCGTGLYINVQATVDMTGVSGATSHVVHCVHPLDGAVIRLAGVLKPTGNVVNVIGDYIRDAHVQIDGADCSSSYSSNGSLFRFVPPTQTPAAATGQACQGLRLDASVRNVRQDAVYITGNAANDANRSDGEVSIRNRGLHGTFVGGSALVRLGFAPDGSSTGNHGLWKVRDVKAPDFTRAAALSTTGGSVRGVLWQGVNEFSDGCRLDGVPFLAATQVRGPATTGLGTAIVTVGDRSVLYLYRLRGCGQTLSAAQVGVTNIGTVGTDGSGIGMRVGAYADDGTGMAPALNVAPLYDAGLIDLSVTGNRSAGAAFTEPVGDYWVGGALQYTTAPTTLPTVVTMANPVLMAPVGIISTGTTANQARCWKQLSVSGALGALTAITQDQSAHVALGLVV